MNPEMLTGRSVRGAIAYITHDAPSDDNPRPTTAARVAWTHCLNLPSDNPELAGRIMQGTIYDAPALKRLAGLSNRGRKLTEPALHLILSWRHDESPLPPHLQSLLNDKPELRAGLTKYAAIETTLSALKELGIEDHQVVLACHTDKDHLHVHAVANRVHPDTGRAAKLSHSKRILNRWAEQYEVERGQVVTPNRIARREAIADRQKARAEGRELPPMPPKQPKRGPGRREQTVDERRVWAQMREAQKSNTDTTEEKKRAQRVEVARLLGQLNETASAPAPTVEVPAPVAVPVRPHVLTPGAELPPAPSVQVPAPVVVPVRPHVLTPGAELPPAPQRSGSGAGRRARSSSRADARGGAAPCAQRSGSGAGYRARSSSCAYTRYGEITLRHMANGSPVARMVAGPSAAPNLDPRRRWRWPTGRRERHPAKDRHGRVGGRCLRDEAPNGRPTQATRHERGEPRQPRRRQTP